MKEERIKIMHFVHSLNEGGIERLLLEICNRIDKNKFEIQICCLVEKGSLAPEFVKRGIKIHLVNARRDFKIKNFLPNLSVLIKIINLLKKEEIDISHGHEFFSTVFSRFASVFAGVKKRYITLHNVYTWWGSSIHKIQKLLSYITTKIICNSKATLNYSVKNDKINKEKYLLIYNGIDCNRFSPKNLDKRKFLCEFNIDEEKIICMSVGSISPRKGLEYLIKATGDLRDQFPQLVYFLVGDKHSQEDFEYEKIEQLICKLNLKDKVFITGNRNDVSEILNFCDLYIMPSVVEGFGLALVEAMAMERVCIASDIEPFKEIIDNGEDGFLFKAQDETELAKKIKEILAMNKSRLNKVKLDARKKAVEKFSSFEMIKQYEKLYSE